MKTKRWRRRSAIKIRRSPAFQVQINSRKINENLGQLSDDEALWHSQFSSRLVCLCGVSLADPKFHFVIPPRALSLVSGEIYWKLKHSLPIKLVENDFGRTSSSLPPNPRPSRQGRGGCGQDNLIVNSIWADKVSIGNSGNASAS